MPNAPTPLLQGTLELIVLQMLRSEPTNGYDLSLRIQAISRDVLQVNAGSPVSRALSTGGTRADPRRVAGHPARPPGEGVLRDRSGPKTTRRATWELGAVRRRPRRHPRDLRRSMSFLHRIVLRLRAILGRGRLAREMDEEMRQHLELATERYVARGLSPSDARAAARSEFGNLPMIEDAARQARGARWVDALVGDLRFAFRYFGRHKASTAIILVVLALGTGANTLIFSMIQAQFFRPAPAVPKDDAHARFWARERSTSTGPWQSREFTLPELLAVCGAARRIRRRRGVVCARCRTAERRQHRRPRRRCAVRHAELLLRARHFAGGRTWIRANGPGGEPARGSHRRHVARDGGRSCSAARPVRLAVRSW